MPLMQRPLKTMPDKYFKRKVKVRCHHKNGCEWVGELRNISTHIETCQLEEVECDFSYAGCTSKLRRVDNGRPQALPYRGTSFNCQQYCKVMLQEQADLVQMQQARLQEQEATFKKHVATTQALMTSLHQQQKSPQI